MNIINAAFVRNGVTVRTLPVYQYDSGMILKISGLDDLPSTFRVDFANTETGQSKSVIGTDNAVHVPYEYFVPGATIHCWLVWTGADYTVTRKHIMIPVARRAVPTDEEPTPDEQGVIDQAIAALNDAVTQTGQDVDAAAGYAGQAEQSAQAAVASQTAAEAAKDQAVQSATAASASAQSASESAQSAFQSKTDAQAAAARATQSADAAQTSAQSAQTAADQAQAVLPQVETIITESLQQAKESGEFDGPQGPKGDKGDTGATGPQGPKGDPGEVTQTEFDDLSDDVTDLKSAMAQAEAALDEKAAAIHTAAGPAPIVSIPDAAAAPVDALTVGIEPVQDLHGYDNPWPAGGGKNKLKNYGVSGTESNVVFTVRDDGTVNANGTASGNIIFTVSKKDSSSPNGAYCRLSDIGIEADKTYVLNGCFAGGSLSTYVLQLLVYGSGHEPYDTGSGSAPFSFTADDIANKWYRLAIRIYNGTQVSNLVFKPMIRIASETDGTFAPYSNICPITGWTGAKVTRTGKNLANLRLYSGGAYNPTIGSTWNLSESSAQLTDIGNGQFSVALGLWAFRVLVFDLMDGQSYRFKCGFSGVDLATTYGYLDENNTVLAKYNETGATIKKAVSFTGSSKHRKAYVGFAPRDSEQTITLTEPQLELGSTATAYDPYQGSTYDITFPSEAGTVYGGTLDVTNGVLTVDRAEVDLGTLTWNKIDTTRGHWRFWAVLNTMLLGGNMLSSQYKQVGASEQYIGVQGIANQQSGNNTLAMVSDERFADVAAFKTAMNGVQLVYELATPIEYTLTALEVLELLKGVNNVWADTGDTSVTYRADTKLYIDNKITQAIAAALNS